MTHPRALRFVEDEALAVDEDVRAGERAEAVDDVERAHDEQQHCRERGSTGTSHVCISR